MWKEPKEPVFIDHLPAARSSRMNHDMYKEAILNKFSPMFQKRRGWHNKSKHRWTDLRGEKKKKENAEEVSQKNVSAAKRWNVLKRQSEHLDLNSLNFPLSKRPQNMQTQSKWTCRGLFSKAAKGGRIFSSLSVETKKNYGWFTTPSPYHNPLSPMFNRRSLWTRYFKKKNVFMIKMGSSLHCSGMTQQIFLHEHETQQLL